MQVNEEYYKVIEVARILRVSKMTVYRMCHSGAIEHRMIGRSFRIPRRALAALLPEGEAK